MSGEHSDSSSLVAPMPIKDLSEIDLKAGPGEKIQCEFTSKPTVGILLLLASAKGHQNMFTEMSGSLACGEGRVCLCSLHNLQGSLLSKSTWHC